MPRGIPNKKPVKKSKDSGKESMFTMPSGGVVIGFLVGDPTSHDTYFVHCGDNRSIGKAPGK